MKTTLLIFSICLNFYLFYRYIKKKNEMIDYKWMYNRTQLDLDRAALKVEHLRETNNELKRKVFKIIKRKGVIHE